VEIEQALEFHHSWDRAGGRRRHGESFDWHKLSAIDSGLGPSPSLAVSSPTFQVGHVDPGRSLMDECCDADLG
jgi:hypothetical protein